MNNNILEKPKLMRCEQPSCELDEFKNKIALQRVESFTNKAEYEAKNTLIHQLSNNWTEALDFNKDVKPYEVLENTVKPEYKSNIEWLEFPVAPITDYEKSLLVGTVSPTELLELEKVEQQIKETEDQLRNRIRKEMITKVKVVALDKLNFHPLTNTSRLSTRDKKRIMVVMSELMDLPDNELTTMFNEICVDSLFSPEADYTKYLISSNIPNRI